VQAGRYADDYGVCRNVVCDHRARTYERPLPDADTADDGRVRSQCGAAPDVGLLVVFGGVARKSRARGADVGKHHARSAEDIVLEYDTVVDGDVVLNLDSIADPHAACHEDVLSELAVPAYDGAAHDVTEMPDLGVVADDGSIIDDRAIVDESGHFQPAT